MNLGANRGFAVGDFWLRPGNVSVGPLAASDGQIWSAPDVCNGNARNPLFAPVITLASGDERAGEALIVDLAPAVAVSGLATGPQGPLAWQGLILESEGFDALGWTEGLPYASTSTDGAGRFTFLGVAAGNYVLRTYRIPQVLRGSPPGTAPEGETLSAVVPVSVGREALTDLSVTLTVAVQPSARVVFPTDRTRWIGQGALPRRQRLVDVRNGSYSVEGLPPGEYFVCAVPVSASGNWQHPDRFAQWAGTAQRVTLGPRESRTIDLTLGGTR